MFLELGKAASTLGTFLISDAGQKTTQNLIALAALGLAVRGVRNWNRERRDLRRAELAEKALTTAHRAYDAIALVRSPLGYSGEGSSRQADKNETPDDTRALNAAYVPVERLRAATEVFDEIKSLRYSLIAAFGIEAANKLLVFLDVHNQIAHAAYLKMSEVSRPPRRRPKSEAAEQAAIERSERIDAVIWQNYSDDDQIVVRLNDGLASLDRIFRPYIEARFRRPGWFRWRSK